MRLLVTLTFLLATGCGGAYTANVKVEPVDVNVKADITISDIMSGFRIQCRREHPEYSTAEVNDCASGKFATLISDITTALN